MPNDEDEWYLSGGKCECKQQLEIGGICQTTKRPCTGLIYRRRSPQEVQQVRAEREVARIAKVLYEADRIRATRYQG